MRRDMHKVIVERPRLADFAPSRPPRWEKNADPDDLPAREGIRRRHVVGNSSKQLNENLAPLKRYLRKQVGRPWNAVYRDISRRLRPTSAVQQHVRDHVWDYVTRHVTIDPSGELLVTPPFRPAWRTRLAAGDLFIHPETGLLAVVKPRRRAKKRRKGGRGRTR
ncbi:MAG: hypothetical protein ACRENB_08525 [Gemmatimonadales bacterium]